MIKTYWLTDIKAAFLNFYEFLPPLIFFNFLKFLNFILNVLNLYNYANTVFLRCSFNLVAVLLNSCIWLVLWSIIIVILIVIKTFGSVMLIVHFYV